ncbi:NADPH:quinone oxidoreductase [Pararhizobium polonicum]|uniref:NADPH:quinone oxidoreductase n=1 Tax=Pararhizobium polonicum TaxID=1612624 RepID=A0A1C7NTD2_9HYPH|nr:NADPH:quinone oxidoreductase family protein [Pararhizobium polonicum]OBZ92247.1 NADPH:quinone oxidoreductase [Pararhizobium polonicum]
MKAVQFSQFGPPDVLQIIEIPVPVPARGEVLVRVRSAGINYFEVLMRSDRYAVTPQLPMIPGVEVAGIVEQLGPDADPALLGTRVGVPLFAAGRGCGYAEFVAIDATTAVPLPGSLGFDDAVALMVQGLTAFHLVRQSPPADRTVLVNAAAGGVGSLLVQLIKREGAKRVVAAASSERKRDLAHALGADLAIDYSRADWTDTLRARTGGADIIYETIGGPMTKAALRALAPGGKIVFAALGRFELDRTDMNRMFDLNQSIKGFALLPLLSPENLRRDLSELFDLAAAGMIKVVQGGAFPLHEAARAHAAIESRSTSGKIVLNP